MPPIAPPERPPPPADGDGAEEDGPILILVLVEELVSELETEDEGVGVGEVNANKADRLIVSDEAVGSADSSDENVSFTLDALRPATGLFRLLQHMLNWPSGVSVESN